MLPDIVKKHSRKSKLLLQHQESNTHKQAVDYFDLEIPNGDVDEVVQSNLTCEKKYFPVTRTFYELYDKVSYPCKMSKQNQI